MRFRATEASILARQFGVSDALMERFLARFSPKRVAKDTFRADNDIMLFVHIPKTAGMSVGRSLQEGFDKFRGVRWEDVGNSFRLLTREAIYLRTHEKTRQVIMGHYGWSEMQVWRNHELPMKCGTIFRDPVARVISNYNYNCSEAHPDNARFRERFPSLTSFVEQVPLDAQISQAIGLVDSFETVLTKLVTYYSFLGIAEDIGGSLAHLARSHGLSRLTEFRENVGRTPAAEEDDADLRQLVERRSHNDIKLHQLLMKIYGKA